jgi:antitoxin (DNA-binding transcriptional repressor) of toxin-antitoxin stability system
MVTFARSEDGFAGVFGLRIVNWTEIAKMIPSAFPWLLGCCGHMVVTICEVITMPLVKPVGVREFRDHATKYLSAGKPIPISKHGQVIGYYIPAHRTEEQQAAFDAALDKLGRTVDRACAEAGMTEDEFADFFDLSKPMPQI